MVASKDFFEKLGQKMIDILWEADDQISIDDLTDQLIDEGFGDPVDFGDGQPKPLRTLVADYLAFWRAYDQSIVFINEKEVILASLYVPTFTECISAIKNYHDYQYLPRITLCLKRLNIYKWNNDIEIWAENNTNNNVNSLRYIAYLVLLKSNKGRKYVDLALSDPNKRINYLAIQLVSDFSVSQVELIKKIVQKPDNALLIAARGITNNISPKLFEIHLASNDRAIVEAIFIRLLDCRKYEVLPILVRAIQTIKPTIFNKIVDEEFDKYYDKRLKDLAKRRKRLPKSIKAELVELCYSENASVQKQALKAMHPNWLKSDLKLLEDVNTDMNPVGTQWKIRSLYKKNSPNKLKIAEEYLNHKHEMIRDAAVDVLGEIGGKDELDILTKISRDIGRYNPGKVAAAMFAIKERLAASE